MKRKKTSHLRVESLEPRLAMSTFYVAPTGSDQFAGTANAPWQTLQQAANQVHPGDTVVVAPGTYQGFNECTDGTAAQPIVFESASGNPQDTIIQGGSSQVHNGDNVDINGCYVTLQGFTVQNASYNGVLLSGAHDTVSHSVLRNNGWGVPTNLYGGEGLLTSGIANDAVIENNDIYGNREHGVYVGAGADRPVILNNLLHDNGDSTRALGGNGLQINADGLEWPTTGAVIEGNTVYDNVHMGFSFQGVQGSLIANNVVYDNGSSIAVAFTKSSVNNRFLNNTVISETNGSAGVNKAVFIGMPGNYPANTGNQLYDNILVAANGVPLVFDGGNGPIASDFNLFWTGNPNGYVSWNDTAGNPISLAAWQAHGFDAHSQSANPLFVAPLSGNFHLQAGSPGVNAGTAVDASGVNLNPNLASYHQGHDVGAYGYQIPFFAAPLLPGAVEQAPVAWRDYYQAGADGSLAVSAANGVLANDQDANGVALKAILVKGPSQGTLVLNPDGSFTYQAKPGSAGYDSFTYQASDGHLLSNVTTVAITIPQTTTSRPTISPPPSTSPPPIPAPPTSAPRVQAVLVNGGGAQRSMVDSLEIVFNEIVTLPKDAASAFVLTGPQGVVSIKDATVHIGYKGTATEVILTWAGPGIINRSLPDGHYTLTVLGSQVTNQHGEHLVGNSGANRGNYSSSFFRLFGDTNGDGVVNEVDYTKFQSAFGKSNHQAGYLWYLDYDGLDRINSADLAQFLKRMHKS